MKLLDQQLKRFGRRIRFVRLWRGAWLGLLAGACLAMVGVGLDYVLVVNFPALWGAILAGVGLVVGGAIGFVLPVSELAVARSVDRRAGLEDRAATAFHKQGSGEFFEEDLERDAEMSLDRVEAKAIYPFRFGAQQMGACLALALLVTGIYVAENDLLLTDAQKAAKGEPKSVAAQVERVAKNLEIEGGAPDRAAEKKLAAELRKFGRELERGKLDREEAMQKAEKLAQDAKRLSEQRLEKAGEKMEQIQARAMQEKFEEAGGDLGKLADLKLDSMEMEMMRDLMQQSGADQMRGDQIDDQMMTALGADQTTSELMRMSEAQKERLAEVMARAKQEAEQQLSEGGLSDSERKALEQQMEAMENLAQKLEMSEDVKKALEELQNMAEFKEMQELMKQMQQAQQQMQQGEPMTEEQMKQMQEQMEQLAEMMKDPAAREAMRQAMKEMMEQMRQGNMNLEQMQQMMQMLGMGGTDGQGGTQGGQYMGEGENEKRDDPMELEGKGKVTAVRGDRDEKRGNDSFSEIKAPTMLGSRTSVPYKEALPGYKKSAESAVSNNKVKGKHRERVKEYFEQLSGGGN
ncbi:hypothetical protein CCB80_11755 [Armatimonadetes bacterium Uphvl-Ar1]|nr:hypothetical protein CCB80_11755 [Armatimonadetes bacterium Uphvl-Ar1]